jgi:hypothetical protein
MEVGGKSASPLCEKAGSKEGIVALIWVDKSEEGAAREFLAKHG